MTTPARMKTICTGWPEVGVHEPKLLKGEDSAEQVSNGICEPCLADYKMEIERVKAKLAQKAKEGLSK